MKSILIGALAVSGCGEVPPASAPPAPPSAGTIETIRYEATPCYGRCPSFVIEARSDGTARFEGLRFTAVEGVRDFRISAAQFAQYRDRLAPYRPQGERLLDEVHCPVPAATDMPSLDVQWRGKGPTDHLRIYLGCDPERNADMVEVVGRAPELLGITAWVRGD